MMLEFGKDATDNSKGFEALLADVLKAFDCLCHLLIAKLHGCDLDIFSLDLLHDHFFKKIAAWLPQRQFWATFEKATLLTRWLSLRLMLIWPEGYRESDNEVGSQSPAEHLVGFEPGSFQFWMWGLNLLGHSHLLWNRMQRTKLESFFNSREGILSGIPQGSILGPFCDCR